MAFQVKFIEVLFPLIDSTKLINISLKIKCLRKIFYLIPLIGLYFKIFILFYSTLPFFIVMYLLMTDFTECH